jgi:hypothetical protein
MLIVLKSSLVALVSAGFALFGYESFLQRGAASWFTGIAPSNVKGLSTQGTYTLELEQVYVELTITPSALTTDSLNPVSSAAQLEGKTRNEI